jgi:hypothetical protein
LVDLVEVVDAGRRAELFEPRQHRPILLRQSIEGGDEEGARAAGGVDDRQALQCFEPTAPIGDLLVRWDVTLAHAMPRAQFCAPFIERATNGLLDEEPRHHVRRVNDARPFALRHLRRRFAACCGPLFFDVGDRLLENVAEDGHRHFAAIIPIAERRDLLGERFRQNERIDDRVVGE